RLFVVGARVERAVRALLQLDRIRAPLVRGLDELLRLLELALVVVTDLRDHVARRVVADFHAFDRELSDVRHRRSMLVAGAATLRSADPTQPAQTTGPPGCRPPADARPVTPGRARCDAADRPRGARCGRGRARGSGTALPPDGRRRTPRSPSGATARRGTS